MSEPFLAEIVMFAGNFNPRGWAYCNGQLLQVSQNSALFSLLGTTYGGDGRTTFALPDLRGRSPRHSGGNSAGPGLPAVQLGAQGGSLTSTLTVNNLPAHNHELRVNSGDGDSNTPVDSYPANVALPTAKPYSSTAPDAQMGADTTTDTGGGQAVNILSPYLGINFIIATVGIFPSRN